MSGFDALGLRNRRSVPWAAVPCESEDGFRETVLPNGEVIRGSGRAVIYSDMIRTVISDIPKAVSVKVETIDEAGTKFPRVHLESPDKQLVGRIAARIRQVRPPEPYNGKGVRYTGERIREKAGKAGKAGG